MYNTCVYPIMCVIICAGHIYFFEFSTQNFICGITVHNKLHALHVNYRTPYFHSTIIIMKVHWIFLHTYTYMYMYIHVIINYAYMCIPDMCNVTLHVSLLINYYLDYLLYTHTLYTHAHTKRLQMITQNNCSMKG